MGTSSVAVKSGITSFTVVGGTDQVFEPDGTEVANGVHLFVPAVADFYARPTMTLRNRSTKIVNGSIVKSKRWYNLSQPRLTPAGILYYDVMRVEFEIGPDTAAADADSFVNKGVHMLCCAALANFRATGSLV